MALTHPSSPMETTWPSCLWVTAANPVQLGASSWHSVKCGRRVYFAVWFTLYFLVCSHCLYVFIKCRQFLCVCLHGLRLRVSMCLCACIRLLFAPDQSPKQTKGWMLFCYEYFTLLLVSLFPPTVSGCLALIQQQSQRHWCRHFR